MAEHDFRYSLLNPQHTLSRYQVTGNGGSILSGDTLLVTLKGSRDLCLRLQVEKVRRLISPPGQWVAVAKGPVFGELAILNWQVKCDSCPAELDFEFAVDVVLGKKAQAPAAQARISELGWQAIAAQHRCPNCQENAQ